MAKVVIINLFFFYIFKFVNIKSQMISNLVQILKIILSRAKTCKSWRVLTLHTYVCMHTCE